VFASIAEPASGSLSVWVKYQRWTCITSGGAVSRHCRGESVAYR
jgi:hypothetical protein